MDSKTLWRNCIQISFRHVTFRSKKRVAFDSLINELKPGLHMIFVHLWESHSFGKDLERQCETPRLHRIYSMAVYKKFYAIKRHNIFKTNFQIFLILHQVVQMWKSDSYKPKRLNRMFSSNRTRVRNNTLEKYTFENYLQTKMVRTIEAKTEIE